MSLYVQYGCGLCAPDDWQNYDVSLSIRAGRIPLFGRLIGKKVVQFPDNVRIGDIVHGLPVAEGSADAVYASHVLEHLTREDFAIALINTWRILKPGGVFRLIVPDLEARARLYLKKLGAGELGANDWFMSVSSLGQQNNPKGIVERLRAHFGASPHLWMWDWHSMKIALEKAGFTAVRRCEVGDSGDPRFKSVESPGRFYDVNEQIQELAVHSEKAKLPQS